MLHTVSLSFSFYSIIEENVLRSFLMEHRSEVVKVVKLDYTFDRQLMLEREDSREEGRAEGRAEGLNEGRAEGRTEGLAEGQIICCRNMGKTRQETTEYLIENLHVTKEEAGQLLNRYWK